MTKSSLMADSPADLEQPWTREHVRATRDDETYVAAPELLGAGALARANRDLLRGVEIRILGRTLDELRIRARADVCLAAREYTATWRPVARDCVTDRLLFVGGHQPTLFHPGVWAKNFVVAELAKRQGFVGLNLVVDTDMQTSAAVRVPRGTADRPAIEAIPFDHLPAAQPWEEARIVDQATFEAFAERVESSMAEWGISPLVSEIWPTAIEQSRRGARLPDCLTAARNVCEQRWGTENLEVPVSRLCQLEPFHWFAAHILDQLPRFHRVYNEVLREYRVINRIRSRSHPVPDLREQDGWLEAPFRIWSAGDRQRKRIFAKRAGGELLLSDDSVVFAQLPVSANGLGDAAVSELHKLSGRGLRFRTRALTTTLFARLGFADLFVHGIGGAKYDQITDRIMSRFFGIEGPGFLTLSATLLLPLPVHPVTVADERRLRSQLRELDFHSDRHLPIAGDGTTRQLIAEKLRLIAEQQLARSARGLVPSRDGAARSVARGQRTGYDRFRRLQEINQSLAKVTMRDRLRLDDDLHRTRNQLAANVVLHDREYPYCLFPAEKLRRFMDHVCRFAEQ